MKKPEHKQHYVEAQKFDGYNKNLPIQTALGSERVARKQEAADIRSTNYVPNVSGWRLTPKGLELGASSGVFPPGTVTFTDIQSIATARILGRTTAATGVVEQLTAAQVKTLLAIVKADISDLPVLTSGTYTPTLTNVANLDASTSYEAQYMRVGSAVTVSGRVDVDPTLAATSTQLGISLPIASNLGATEDCAGTAHASGIATQGAAILADATNDRAQMQFISADVTNQAMYYTFTYQVV